MSLESLEALATEYERQYLQATNDVNALSIRSVNDISVTVDSIRNVLNYYSEASRPVDELSATSGPFYSKTSIVGKGNKTREKIVGGIKIPETAFANYLEKCFSCEGRIRFQFEMMPSGQFFLQIEDMLDEIERAIAALLNAFKPNEKFINELCALLNMLSNIACPQDLINLALALQLLITAKLSAFLSIKLNWWGLFGFAIKWFMDLLSNLIEQLANILEAPLKCLRSAMIAGLETLRAFDKAFETLEKDNSGNAVIKVDPVTQRLQLKLTGEAFLFPEPVEVPVAVYDYSAIAAMAGMVTGKAAGTEEPKAAKEPVSTRARTPQELQERLNAFEAAPLLKDSSIQKNLSESTAITVYESYLPVSLSELTLPEQILALTDESIAYIENLKLKILEALASVSLLVKKNKVLEIKTLVNIKFLTSIIALLIYLGQLDSLKDLCRTEGGNADIKKVLRQMLNADDVQVIGNGKALDISYTVDGETKQTQIASCMTAKYEADQAMAQLANLLEEFSK